MIHCVVFDFDGTLVDSNPIKRCAFYELARPHPDGIAIMGEVLHFVRGDRSAVLDAYADRMRHQGLYLDVDELVRAYGELTDQRVAVAEEMPGAKRLLRELQACKIMTHLCSSTPVIHLESILSLRAWRHYFDGVYGSPHSKTNNLCKILTSSRLRSAEVLVVGDGQDDADAARAVSCPFIPVGAGSYSARESGVPATTLDQAAEVILAGRRTSSVPCSLARPRASVVAIRD